MHEQGNDSTQRSQHETWKWETCAVCGGRVESGHGAARINHRGSTVNLCGPRCLEAFAEEPDPYLARLARAMREREWRALIVGNEAGGNGSFSTLVAYPPSSAQPGSRTAPRATLTAGKGD